MEWLLIIKSLLTISRSLREDPQYTEDVEETDQLITKLRTRLSHTIEFR
jgi:hypothetical protein